MAAQNVSGNINVNIALTEYSTAGSVPGSSQYSTNQAISTALTYATATAGAIDTIYASTLSLAAAVTTLNLHSGLTDPLGNSIAFGRVRFWIVQNTATTAGYLINLYTLTGTDPLLWLPLVTTATLWVPAGGILMGIDSQSTSTNGWLVTAAHYTFSLDPGGNTVPCNVIIAGNTAA